MLDAWVRFPNCGLWGEGFGAEWNSEQGSGNRKGGYAAPESGPPLCLDTPFVVAPESGSLLCLDTPFAVAPA